MNVSRAVITAASPSQRLLPLQRLVDRDGQTKSLLTILVEEALRAGIENIGVVICPGDEEACRKAVGEHAARLTFLPQEKPRGYGHAIWCARGFVSDSPFLHMIGDHVFVHAGGQSSAAPAVEAARVQECSVSAVQATREHLLPYFGAIGGRRVPGTQDLYQIDCVLEKPTPTEAEQSLVVPGIRAGHYLTFFGIHVLTPAVMELLDRAVQQGEGRVELSPVLSELARREKYLAQISKGRRYPVDSRYGLLTAQLALGLSGKDREEVLAILCEMLAQREPGAPATA